MKQTHKNRSLSCRKTLLSTVITLVLLFILTNVSYSQTPVDEQETVQQPQPPQQRVTDQRILVDEEEQVTIIEIRSPDIGVLPRRVTEEIRFSLNFIREQFLQSNRKLY